DRRPDRVRRRRGRGQPGRPLPPCLVARACRGRGTAVGLPRGAHARPQPLLGRPEPFPQDAPAPLKPFAAAAVLERRCARPAPGGSSGGRPIWNGMQSWAHFSQTFLLLVAVGLVGGAGWMVLADPYWAFHRDPPWA